MRLQIKLKRQMHKPPHVPRPLAACWSRRKWGTHGRIYMIYLSSVRDTGERVDENGTEKSDAEVELSWRASGLLNRERRWAKKSVADSPSLFFSIFLSKKQIKDYFAGRL